MLDGEFQVPNCAQNGYSQKLFPLKIVLQSDSNCNSYYPYGYNHNENKTGTQAKNAFFFGADGSQGHRDCQGYGGGHPGAVGAVTFGKPSGEIIP
jgi:hypothetical protein